MSHHSERRTASRPHALPTGLAAAAALLALFSGVARAAPISVSAGVAGDLVDIVPFTQAVDPATGRIVDALGDPVPLSSLPHLAYGDFLVSGGNDLGATFTTVGDGINDETWWVFDFTADANLAAFAASGEPLTSALLTLTVVPREGTPPRDERAFVPGLNGAYDVPLPGAQDDPDTVQVQLVRPELVALGQAHPAASILAQLDGSGSTGPGNALVHGAGQLPFKFFDDAQVLSASLVLTRGTAVPAPATLALCALGFGVVALRKAARQVEA